MGGQLGKLLVSLAARCRVCSHFNNFCSMHGDKSRYVMPIIGCENAFMTSVSQFITMLSSVR